MWGRGRSAIQDGGHEEVTIVDEAVQKSLDVRGTGGLGFVNLSRELPPCRMNDMVWSRKPKVRHGHITEQSRLYSPKTVQKTGRFFSPCHPSHRDLVWL